MAILNAVARWRRGDFQPRLEDEKHQDILIDLLRSLRLRAADTHFVWVAAHVGDQGNELADIEANLGTQSEDRMWELDTFPIALHSTATSTSPLLHAATWTPTVDRHAKNFVGQKQAEWLRNFSTARSTDFTLREANSCEILGKVLSDTTLPELATRDLLQARSFCFPTAMVVSRNHCGAWSTKCRLCKAAVDTFAHRFMSCPELHGAQQTMHDDISSALVRSTANVLERQGHIPPRVEHHLARQVDYLWPDCPLELKGFVPDGIIITHAYPPSRAPSRIVIIEFARSYTIEEEEMLTAGAAKRNQYISRVSFADSALITTSAARAILSAFSVSTRSPNGWRIVSLWISLPHKLPSYN
eukprot:1065338-Rhodomonas_salina.2